MIRCYGKKTCWISMTLYTILRSNCFTEAANVFFTWYFIIFYKISHSSNLYFQVINIISWRFTIFRCLSILEIAISFEIEVISFEIELIMCLNFLTRTWFSFSFHIHFQMIAYHHNLWSTKLISIITLTCTSWQSNIIVRGWWTRVATFLTDSFKIEVVLCFIFICFKSVHLRRYDHFQIISSFFMLWDHLWLALTLINFDLFNTFFI